MADQQPLANNKAFFDLDAGLARVRGNQAIFKKMLGLFLNSTEFDAFETQLAAQDYAAASETAHAIKGITGNLSMPALFETSSQLMTDLREGKLDEALLAEYRAAYTATRTAVEQAVATMG